MTTKARRGRPPLPKKVVEAAKKMLAAGCSQRHVSRKLGIARSSVQTIQYGRWCQGPQVDPEAPRKLAKAVLCPTCEHLIEIVPCQLCLARTSPKKAPRRSAAKPAGSRMQVRLRDQGQRDRYRGLRARKRQAGEKPLSQDELDAKYEAEARVGSCGAALPQADLLNGSGKHRKFHGTNVDGVPDES